MKRFLLFLFLVDIPIQRDSKGEAPATIELVTVSQGCADLGVCYPPETQKTTVNLMAESVIEAPSEPTSNESARDLLDNLGNKISNRLGFSNPANKFLEPDEAYQASFEITPERMLVAHWDIAEGYYMYRDKFAFQLVNMPTASLGVAQVPRGEVKDDPNFGKTNIFHNEVSIKLPVFVTDVEPQPTHVTLEVKYQGCAEAGFCYPPITKTLDLELPALVAGATVGAGDAAPLSAQDSIAKALVSDNLFLTVLKFFVFGLALAFTPCVFPMVPILSSIIVGQGSAQNTRKAFTLSLIYVLAMALTYTALGVIAGLFGKNLQAVAQSPWVIVTFSAVFVLLALSMFGFYQLQMPSHWQSKLTTLSNKQRGGNWIGVAIMGFLSALIVGPCVAAPLAGALIVIAQSGDAVLGGLALFAMSLGMGAPLLVIGTSLGKWLPKAGGWMDNVKVVFGVLLLAVAIWLLERILPPSATLLMWAGLFIMSAIYLGALQRSTAHISGWRKLCKGLGLQLLIYGGILVVGAVTGGKDVLHPLQGLMSTSGQSSAQPLAFKRIKGVAQLEQEIAAASKQHKVVVLDFYADWCVACKELEKFTFSDPKVQTALADVVLLQADITPYDAEDEALVKHFGLIGPPAILFFGPDGQERVPFRVVGFLDAEKFRAHLQKALF